MTDISFNYPPPITQNPISNINNTDPNQFPINYEMSNNGHGNYRQMATENLEVCIIFFFNMQLEYLINLIKVLPYSHNLEMHWRELN
jgi:hypothetical protein